MFAPKRSESYQDKSNLIFIGMPGSGKTNIGKRFSSIIGFDFLDVDNHIEATENAKVGDLIQQMGEERFLDFEQDVVMALNPSNTVISCSGSVPLRQDAMNHLRKKGHSILIDVPLSVIYGRLSAMKVDRIIGMNGEEKLTLEQILAFRKGFYEMSHDFRFSYDGNIPKEETFARFLEFFK